MGGVWKEHNPTVQSQDGLWKDYEQTLTFTLPALGASIWKVKRKVRKTKSKTSDKNDDRLTSKGVQALKRGSSQ